jgi:hypothetical protein
MTAQDKIHERFRGIVSRDFWLLFMISLDSYEVRILRPDAISIFKFKKIGLGGKELFKIMNPGTITVLRISCNACCQPCLPVTANVVVHSSTVYKVILLGSTSSNTRNLPEEWLLRMQQLAVTLYISYKFSRNH